MSKRLQLRAEGCRSRALFRGLEALPIGLHFDQHFPLLDFPAEDQARGDHATGDRCGDRIDTLDLEASGFAHLVQRDASEREPAGPAAEQDHSEAEGDRRGPHTVLLHAAKGPRKIRRHQDSVIIVILMGVGGRRPPTRHELLEGGVVLGSRDARPLLHAHRDPARRGSGGRGRDGNAASVTAAAVPARLQIGLHLHVLTSSRRL